MHKNAAYNGPLELAQCTMRHARLSSCVARGRVDLSFVQRCSLGLLYPDPALAFANSAARDGSLARLCVLDDPNTSAITRFAFDFVRQGAPRFRVIERPEGVWKNPVARADQLKTLTTFLSEREFDRSSCSAVKAIVAAGRQHKFGLALTLPLNLNSTASAACIQPVKPQVKRAAMLWVKIASGVAPFLSEADRIAVWPFRPSTDGDHPSADRLKAILGYFRKADECFRQPKIACRSLKSLSKQCTGRSKSQAVSDRQGARSVPNQISTDKRQ